MDSKNLNEPLLTPQQKSQVKISDDPNSKSEQNLKLSFYQKRQTSNRSNVIESEEFNHEFGQ